LEIEPQNSGNTGDYLKYLIAFKRNQEAEKLLSQLQENRPDYFQLEKLRAYLFAAKGEKENALFRFNKITFNEKYESSFTLAVLYLLLNDPEGAIEYIVEGEEDYSKQGITRSKYFRYLNLPYYKILQGDDRFHNILATHKKLYEENLVKYGDINS